MYLKKFLNQPNVLGSVLIALLFSAGVIFTFGFNGFNIETIAEGDAEALLRMSMSGCCGGDDGDDDDFDCKCLTDEAGNKVSCDICEEGNKCSGSQTPSDCTDDCAREDCGVEGIGYCDSDSAVEYCPKDEDANRRYCQGTSTRCDNKVEVPFEDEDEE